MEAELDQLTVTRLKPMSEAPYNIQILAWNGECFEIWELRPEMNKYGDYSKLIGWISMPIYKPEQS
jgi:hypothetical protein